MPAILPHFILLASRRAGDCSRGLAIIGQSSRLYGCSALDTPSFQR